MLASDHQSLTNRFGHRTASQIASCVAHLFTFHRLYPARRVLRTWGSCLSLLFPRIGASAIVSSPYRRIQCVFSLPFVVAHKGGLSEYDVRFPFDRATVSGICISFPKGIGGS